MQFDFTNRKALITGGSRGIGFSLAKFLLNLGAQVWVTGKSKNGNYPKGADYIQADFSNSSDVEALLKQVKLIKPDVLVNNAAEYTPSTFESSSVEEARKVHEITYLTAYQLIRTALPEMQKNKWGRIVNIGTLWTELTPQNRSAYTSSKIALLGLTRNVSSDYSQYNVLCNMLSPGFTKTSWSEGLEQKRLNQIAQKVPVGRLADPIEISKAIAFLISEHNTYITGQNILADGGFTKSHIFV